MTFTCQQIDDLMMEYLYRELDDAQMKAYRAHLPGCPACAALLAGYERTRAVMQSVPAEEPPVAVSAKLLRAAAERPRGLWSRFAAWLSPLTAHPGVAAVATFVVVAGVAGFLVARHGIPERATSANLAEDRVAIAPTSQGARDDVPAAAPAAPMAAAPAEGRPEPGMAEAPAAERQANQPIATESKKKAGKLEDKGLVRMADSPTEEAARRERADGFAEAPAEGLATADADDSAVGDGRVAKAEKDAAAVSGGGARGSVAQAPRAPAPAKPAVTAPDGEMAKPAPTTPAAPPTDSEAPRAAGSATPARDQAGKADAADSDARVLHGQARGKAAGGDCGAVMTLRGRIAKIDPTYYDRNVRNDPDLAKCTTAEKRNAKPSAKSPAPASAPTKPADSK